MLRRAIASRFAQNAAALFGAQFASYVLPLVTLPYLARVLGPTEFGAVAFAQAFATALAVVPEYGFAFVGAREVAGARSDQPRLRAIASEILGAQAMLAAATVPIALLAFAGSSIFRDDGLLFLFAWLAAVLQGLSPIWFFQGIERLFVTAAVEVAGRVATVVLILVLVRDESDGWIVLALQAGAGLTGVVTLLYLLVRTACPRPPRLGPSVAALRRASYVFVGHAAAGLYARANVFVLGLLVAPAQVAIYAAPEKLTQAGTRLLFPVSQAGYPRMATAFAEGDAAGAIRLFRRMTALIVGISVVVAAVLFAAADPIVHVVFGDDFADAVPVLRLLALSLPLVAIAYAITAQWLLPQGSDRASTAIVLLVGACNLALALVLVPPHEARGMAWAVLTAQAVAVAANVVAARRARYSLG